MKRVNVSALRRKIKELERVNAEQKESLFQYKQTVLEIFDGVTDLKADEGISKNWILKRMRKLFR